MLRRTVLTVAVAIAPTAAFAAGEHFNYADAFINGDGNLIADFKEAGLGNTPISYEFTAASCSVTVECENNGGQISPGQAFTATNVSNTTSCTPSNGKIVSPSETCTVQLSCGTESQLQKACPKGKGKWETHITSATYLGVTLRDATTPVLAFEDQDFSSP
jgi:hypothetical protein